MFDCGQYEACANYLEIFRMLSRDDEKRFWALWGKLGAEILMTHFEQAFKDLVALREAIDARLAEDQGVQLQQRTWLIHWSLFILFSLKDEDERTAIIEFLFQDKLLNAMQINCPHILRYLTAAMILRRTHDFKDLLRVNSQERKNYSDPITEFVLQLYVDFDFDAVQQTLRECQTVLNNDQFLAPIASEFMEKARLLFFETYCRIHHCINMDKLAEQLDIKENVEQQLVGLISKSRINAKIDSSKNQLVMQPKRTNVYQQVIDKTRLLAYRSTQLLVAVDKQYAIKQDA